MDVDYKPIHGCWQYPHTDLLNADNPDMDIRATVSRNLSAWMSGNANLDTLKKIAAKSGVGFGTVQRAKNGDGNTTIQNLELIAKAFRRRAIDLLAESDEPYSAPVLRPAFTVQEPLFDRRQTAATDDERTLLDGFRCASDEARDLMLHAANRALAANAKAKPGVVISMTHWRERMLSARCDLFN
jgi:transcriptional regulator with XRE-family HTH domain